MRTLLDPIVFLRPRSLQSPRCVGGNAGSCEKLQELFSPRLGKYPGLNVPGTFGGKT